VTGTEKFILVVDDSEDNQVLLTMLFESRGYRVRCASNGEEALTLLRASDLPSLILLDAQMPIMDGYAFRGEQERSNRLRDIPVLVMTGDEDENVSERMMYPQGVLVKPLQMKSVLNRVSALI